MQWLIEKAKNYATAAHGEIDQRRKYTGEPYIAHPTAVAQMIWDANYDVTMVAAAFLHDVVEDTNRTIDDIKTEFGPWIAELVSDLTDVSKPSDGNRATRKRIDREHTANASAEAKTIKLADLIDNTSSIVKHDPYFAKVYMAEKRELLKHLSEGDAGLFARASNLVENYFGVK